MRRHTVRSRTGTHPHKNKDEVALLSTDHPARGVAIMIVAQAIFAVTDAIAKLLMETQPVMTVVWTRFALFMVFLGPLMLRAPAHLRRTPERPLVVLRAFAMLGATLFMSFALGSLPLATALTLAFIGPFIVTALSALVLKEKVGWRRWSAIAVGFGGVLLIVRPGLGTVGWDAGFVFGSTLCWSIGVIATRRLGGKVDAATMLIWQAIVGVVASAPFAYATWIAPSGFEYALMFVNAVLNLTGQWLTVRALQLAPASTVAPLSYTVIIWATGLGWLFFGTLPDRWTLAGGAIIVASGLYVWWRERTRRPEALAREQG